MKRLTLSSELLGPMLVVDATTIAALSALITSLSAWIWAVRRKP